MKVLLIHNRYREPGGEERSVAQIAALLADRGHEVELLERASASVGKPPAARALLRGGRDTQEVTDVVRSFGPDVVHAHNINPLFGPRALEAARQAGARVVMHLHNYRLACAAATTYRDGRDCVRCKHTTLPGIVHRCRGGLAEPLVYGVALARQRSRVLEAVDCFAVPSEAAIDQLGRLGLPTDRMQELLNFIPAAEFATRSEAEAGGYGLYVGRLVEEKGVDTAIVACAAASVPLVICGEGPDRPRLEGVAARQEGDVRFLGRVDGAELTRVRAQAAFALVPSRWAEPCPYTAIEAMAAGLPVLASDMGGLPEMVGPESVVEARDARGWRDAVASLWADPQARGDRGGRAIVRARELFHADRFYGRLKSIYEGACP